MAECDSEKKLKLHTVAGNFELQEEVTYPNSGKSLFYVLGGTVIILDNDIWKLDGSETVFEYSSITSKQNDYINKYDRVFRFLMEDKDMIDQYLKPEREKPQVDYMVRINDRAELADSSPLEQYFEDHFARVYGNDSVKYLWKEYGITDTMGITRYLDYFVRTSNKDIAVEENGVSYHHPQIIGKMRYRDQLMKQNACTAAGIKLFRFSSEDCKFADRFEDDIRSYFGKSTDGFKVRGLVVDRPVVLYEHQEDTLEEMSRQRAAGIKSFLIVFPTASGKSKIVEEDMKKFAMEQQKFRALILVPNTALRDDWNDRIRRSLKQYENYIDVVSYSYMERHFTDYPPEEYSYVVVDEAHHAVAPGLKRTIQYFTPQFLVGLTATDERPDKRKLETVFGSYRVGLSLQEAMEKGIVAKANAFRIETNIDLSKVRINGKDYINADLERTIRVSSRNELIVNVIREYFTGGKTGERQGIIFCVNVNHANEMERLMNAAGITTRSYSSRSKHPEKIMEDFKEQKIRFLCTCQMISEGWDYPELGIIVMARPTLSKVLYLQQIGRGLRKTAAKHNVFVIDVVDQYGSMVMPCSLHSIFENPYYVPFGDITERNYSSGDFIEIDGMTERVERVVEVDVNSFDKKYGNYLSQEQLAREFFVSTGTITNWIQKRKIFPTVSFPFGNKMIHMFSRENAGEIRKTMGIKEHNDETIRDDFFEFLEERDYSLSYKMPFLMSFLKHMDASGDARIEDVLVDYTVFYQDRINRELPVDRKTCSYTAENLCDRSFVKKNMLTNPFEKFERKRFMYYSRDLNIISMNHALHRELKRGDYDKIIEQMEMDLREYYEKVEAAVPEFNGQ